MSTRARATRRKFIHATAAATAGAVIGAPWIARADAATIKLRIASLAPAGSRWAKIFDKNKRKISELTDGAVEIKMFYGGSMGDEGAMVRKMLHGQLDGAALTSVGLGAIDKQLLMLQLPLLFKDYNQLDYVRGKMLPTFEELLEKAGFKFGAAGDVGFVYFFTNHPVKQPSDLKATKLWVWDEDPISKKSAEVAGVNAVELGVPDVWTSLETGLIDAFVNSPYGAIALRWYEKARYVTNLKLSMGIGASLLTQKAWKSLPADIQTVLEQVTLEGQTSLLTDIRADNKKAMKTLKDKGIEVVEPENFVAWASNAVQVRDKLVADGTFDAKLVETMLGHLKDAPK
jgi:TRAP-type C4-dicarboxylate transport system substrate-binding protein